MNNKDKDIVIFDLDGTLTESKQKLDPEMSDLLSKLLAKKKVAVISGGSYEQFEKQFLPGIAFNSALYKNLFLFPTSGTAFYRFDSGEWKKVYEEVLSADDRKKIINVLTFAEKNLCLDQEKSFGEKIEDRGTQITFSGLGQNAPLEAKQSWDPDQEKRKMIVCILKPFLHKFGINIGGMTSIDITKKGIDKAYGIGQIQKHLNIPIEKMVFVGDALFLGGNDYPAKTTGVDCVEVKTVNDTKGFIRSLV